MKNFSSRNSSLNHHKIIKFRSDDHLITMQVERVCQNVSQEQTQSMVWTGLHIASCRGFHIYEE